ncbi:hypothetical protein HanRHA438_Chr14g0642311 [Helianthus annuus]|nr:hypothetical protein HanRHA438_Chr14g0642311 [Helianthus annuus]
MEPNNFSKRFFNQLVCVATYATLRYSASRMEPKTIGCLLDGHDFFYILCYFFVKEFLYCILGK